MTEVEITIKCSNMESAVVSIDNSSTISDLKEKISERLSVSPSLQRLIFKGRVLKDDLTLEHYEIENGSIVHLVKGFPKPTASAPASSPTTTIAAPSPAPAPQPSSFGGVPSLPGMGGMQDEFLRNPALMEQMMSSPMMDSLMSNPEMLRSIMSSNPQIQALMDSNPQIRQILNDPSILRQSMEMMRNPAAMREAMRSQDLAMSQLENIPGGFNALRRMYEDVQEPLMSASMGPPTSPSTPAQPTTPAPGLTAPNTSALPNPWGSRAAGTPSQLSGFPGLGAFPGGQPGGFTGFPGGPQMDPTQLAAMLDNPMMQQMMQQMMSDPQFIQQISSSNPQMAAALQDPHVRAMISDPATLRRLANPSTLQAMMQMQQAMQVLQANGVAPVGAGSLGAAPFPGFLVPPAPPSAGLDFSSLLGAPRASGLQSLATQPPSERFAAQLQQLNAMGFVDEPSNIAALTQSNGNVNAAVERLLGNF